MSWLVDTLLVTGVLIALVLAARRPVARAFGPGMAYGLWLLPMLRLILPPLVLPAPTVPVAYTVTADSVDVAPLAAPVVEAGWDWQPLLLGLWLGGAALFLIWRLGGYALMRRRILRDAVSVGEARGVRMVESPEVAVPVAFGVIDKVIALPAGFMTTGDPTARDLAIAHELEHHAGRDLAVNFAMQPLLALHWFNPLAWVGWRAMRRDQEAACDARVLAGSDDTTRATYARLIADYARGPQPALAAPMACAVLVEKSVIHRLRSLKMTQPSPRRRLIGRVLIGGAALALPLTASISYAANEQPAPPAAPEAPPAPSAPPELSVSRIVITPAEGADKAAVNQKVSKIVLIDHKGPEDGDETKLSTRTVTRDGKTFVFKTSKPLSDEEVETRIKAIESGASFSADSIEVNPPVAGQANARPPHIITRTAILRGKPKSPEAMAKLLELQGKRIDCEVPDIKSKAEASADGQSVRVIVCGKAEGQALAVAADGLRKTRDKIAKDSRLSDEVRDKIIKQLDAEIERLSKKG